MIQVFMFGLRHLRLFFDINELKTLKNNKLQAITLALTLQRRKNLVKQSSFSDNTAFNIITLYS